MRLELATFSLRDIQFGSHTACSKGTLTTNKDELAKLILEDKRVSSADLDVAYPGEKTRIVKIHDVVEPRVKVSGPGCVFPGILGPVETVGEGRTHTLSGITVMTSAILVMGRRHSAWATRSTAETRVPAWEIPMKNTKDAT